MSFRRELRRMGTLFLAVFIPISLFYLYASYSVAPAFNSLIKSEKIISLYSTHLNEDNVPDLIGITKNGTEIKFEGIGGGKYKRLEDCIGASLQR